MNAESTIRNMLFFTTVKNGLFDYSTPLKTSITNFTENISNTEVSASLFEYLFYNIIKKKINEGYINNETVFISEQFLSSINSKKIFFEANAIHKKNIFIFIQNKTTQKWNVIIFFNLEDQLKKCMLDKENHSIIAKIISSSNKNDEDDYILNTTMDKLENTFDFKSPEDIQFEVDTINISDQPNSSIFLLNFIEGLIMEKNENFSKYIQKLYDEGSKMDANSKNYLNSFNKMNDVFNDLQNKYQTELKNYLEKTKNENIENGIENVDNFVNLNINNETNVMKDDIDLIQIEQDDDIEDDIDSEEEEALKIMEKENEEAKRQMREQEKKLRQKLYKQKMRLKNLNMCKDFGIIKEEENESSSEKSFEIYNKNDKEKSVKDEIAFLKKSINNLRKLTDELSQKNISENESSKKEKEKNIENDTKEKNNNNEKSSENNIKEKNNNNDKHFENNVEEKNCSNENHIETNNIEKNINNEKNIINGNSTNENNNTNLQQKKYNNNINTKTKKNKKQKLSISVLKNFEEAIQELEKETLAQPQIEPKNENSKTTNNKINKTNNNKNSNTNIKKQLDNGNPKINVNKSNELKKAKTYRKSSKMGYSLTIDYIVKTTQKNISVEKKNNKISNFNNEKNVTSLTKKKSNPNLNNNQKNFQHLNKSSSFKSAISLNNSNTNKKEKTKKNNKTKKNKEINKKVNKSPVTDNKNLNKKKSIYNINDEFNKKNSLSSRDSTNTQKTNKTEDLILIEKEKEIKLEHNISNDIEVDNEQNYNESFNPFKSQKINEIKKENNKILFPKNNNNDIKEKKENENGQTKTRRSLVFRRQDRNKKTKLKMPPCKNNNYMPFNELDDLYEGYDNNICGWCVGEESSSGCCIY